MKTHQLWCVLFWVLLPCAVTAAGPLEAPVGTCEIVSARVELELPCISPVCWDWEEWYIVAAGADGQTLWKIRLPERPVGTHVYLDGVEPTKVYVLFADGRVQAFGCSGVVYGGDLKQWFDLPDGSMVAGMGSTTDPSRVRLAVSTAGDPSPVHIAAYELDVVDLLSATRPAGLTSMVDLVFDGAQTRPLDDHAVHSLEVAGDSLRVRTGTVNWDYYYGEYYWRDLMDYELLLTSGEFLSPTWFVDVQVDSSGSGPPTLVATDSRGAIQRVRVSSAPVDFGTAASPRARASLWALFASDDGSGLPPRFLGYTKSGEVAFADSLIHDSGSVTHPHTLRTYERGDGRVLNEGLDYTGRPLDTFRYDYVVVTRDRQTQQDAVFLLDLEDVRIGDAWSPDFAIELALHPEFYFTYDGGGRLISRFQGEFFETFVGNVPPSPCSRYEARYRALQRVNATTIDLIGESGRHFWFGYNAAPSVVWWTSYHIQGTSIQFGSSDGSIDFGLPVLDVQFAGGTIAYALLDAGNGLQLSTIKVQRPVEEVARRTLTSAADSLRLDTIVASIPCKQIVLNGQDYAVAWTSPDRVELPLYARRGARAGGVSFGNFNGNGQHVELRHIWSVDPVAHVAKLDQLRDVIVPGPDGKPTADWELRFDGSDPYIAAEPSIVRASVSSSRRATPVVVRGASGRLQYLSLDGRACIPGDVNAQGDLEPGDAVLALRGMVGLEQFQTVEQRCAADYDQNGSADLYDVIQILRGIAGLTGPISKLTTGGEAPPNWRYDRDAGELVVNLPAPVLGISLSLDGASAEMRFVRDTGVQATHRGRAAWADAMPWSGAIRIVLDDETRETPSTIEHAEAILADGRVLNWRNQPLELGETPHLPSVTALLDPHPNPFNPSTTIGFELARPQRVTLRVVDLRGRTIVDLANGQWEAGRHELRWAGSDSRGRKVASGVYRLRLESEDGEFVKGLLLLK